MAQLGKLHISLMVGLHKVLDVNLHLLETCIRFSDVEVSVNVLWLVHKFLFNFLLIVRKVDSTL